MKILKFIPTFLIGIACWVQISCRATLDLSPLGKSATLTKMVDFNFMYRFTKADSTPLFADTLSRSEPVLIELYLSSLDSIDKNALYKISFKNNPEIDANMVFQEKEYRANDLILIRYKEFDDQRLYMQFVPLNKGKLVLSLICADELGQIKTFQKSCFITP